MVAGQVMLRETIGSGGDWRTPHAHLNGASLPSPSQILPSGDMDLVLPDLSRGTKMWT